jgi:hypothetical protein
MPEFIDNPRRSPRAPVRCQARLVTGQGAVEAETEDIGMRGCQLIAPSQVRRAEPVKLVVTHPRLRETLEASGRVAWASAQEPWRLGIAFDESSHRAARRWYEKLVEANPGLPTLDRVPERIPVEATLYLGAPPRFVMDFTPDEVVVLRAVGSGVTLDDLRVKLRDRWLPCQRAFFSLLARNHATLQRGQAVHPDAWRKILAELEASFAVEAMSSFATPPPAPLGPPSRPGVPAVEPERPAPRPAQASPGAQRSEDAQACYLRGLAEIEAGQVHTGVALLRRAAQLSPGDPEITAALWKASATAGSRR